MCTHGLIQKIFVHILIVSSKCNAVGSFPACFVRNSEFSYPSSWSRNNANSSHYLSSRFLRACMGSYKCFHAVYVLILVVSSQCDAVGSFTVCIYQFLKISNEFSKLSSRSRNNTDSSRYLTSRYGSACMGSYKRFSCT